MMTARSSDTPFPLAPPISPMLAKLTETLPVAGRFLFEPKWDGFLRPLDRYFPELHDALLERLPADSVVDGEIVIPTSHGLDFDALQMRLHPAASRVARLARETPRRSSPSTCSPPTVRAACGRCKPIAAHCSSRRWRAPDRRST